MDVYQFIKQQLNEMALDLPPAPTPEPKQDGFRCSVRVEALTAKSDQPNHDFKCSEMVCDIEAKINNRPAGCQTKANETIFKTCKKIMGEPMPCTDCVQSAKCPAPCSLFNRYVNSRGKPWREC